MHVPQHAGLRTRTRVIDAVLAGLSGRLDTEAEIDVALDCALGGLTAACRSVDHLVDFDEFVGREAF